MSIPAIIILGFVFLEIVVAMTLHGRPKGKWNAGATLLNEAVIVGLLYWGGFFA